MSITVNILPLSLFFYLLIQPCWPKKNWRIFFGIFILRIYGEIFPWCTKSERDGERQKVCEKQRTWIHFSWWYLKSESGGVKRRKNSPYFSFIESARRCLKKWVIFFHQFLIYISSAPIFICCNLCLLLCTRWYEINHNLTICWRFSSDERCIFYILLLLITKSALVYSNLCLYASLLSMTMIKMFL